MSASPIATHPVLVIKIAGYYEESMNPPMIYRIDKTGKRSGVESWLGSPFGVRYEY